MDTVKIYGRLTDFDGNPLEGGGVEIKREDFQTCAYVLTDSDGRYSVEVKKGEASLFWKIPEAYKNGFSSKNSTKSLK